MGKNRRARKERKRAARINQILDWIGDIRSMAAIDILITERGSPEKFHKGRLANKQHKLGEAISIIDYDKDHRILKTVVDFSTRWKRLELRLAEDDLCSEYYGIPSYEEFYRSIVVFKDNYTTLGIEFLAALLDKLSNEGISIGSSPSIIEPATVGVRRLLVNKKTTEVKYERKEGGNNAGPTRLAHEPQPAKEFFFQEGE